MVLQEIRVVVAVHDGSNVVGVVAGGRRAGAGGDGDGSGAVRCQSRPLAPSCFR